MAERFLYKRPENKNPKINVQYMYPAIESFAMASLGYLSIFKMLDCDSELFIERVYSDTKNTLINPKNVDCIGFSTSFELDITTIIKMLEKYGIPLKAKERKETDPIIFAGGPVLMSNPLPYQEIFDFISIGEKSCLVPAFEILKTKKDFSKDEILKKLSEVKGIYVPRYKKEKVEIVRDDIEFDPVFTPILSDKSFFSDTFVIEIERGCPKMCNFCLAGFLNHPVRYVNLEKIIEAIDFGLQYTDKLALLGAYVAGHPDFNKIMGHISKICEKRNIELSISSLRADLTDIELIKTLVKCGQKTATIALEAASQRLRDFINKNLSEAQILKTVETAQKGGLKGLKIYIMTGLPTETDRDIEEFIELAKKMKDLIKKNAAPFTLTFSASTFIPKIGTPFEKADGCDKKTLEKRINYLKKNFHKLGINFRTSSLEWDLIQRILSRYDDDMTDFLIDVTHNGANLGAFRQQYRKYQKKGLLKPFEQSVICPFDKTKPLKQGFVVLNNESLKEKIINNLPSEI